ncbi:MAG: PAS domain-containing sensor histidine kinase [Chloroflexi bacterium]|nr:PAS domain-containing sensor histidine kinase [Chloroflexota bacterium]
MTLAPSLQHSPRLLLERLYPYRPRVHDWRFWALQGLVMLMAAAHAALEIAWLQQFVPANLRAVFFVPISFFFIPVIYAALNFGFSGSLATTVWCTLLAVPNVLLFHHGLGRVEELSQLGIFNAIAVFVGHRVEQETRARNLLQVTSARYRSLFESSPAAILVLSDAGEILEVNPPAGLLFGSTSELVKGRRVAELLGEDGARHLLSPGLHRSGRGDLVLERSDGSLMYLESTSTRLAGTEGEGIVQAVLSDATEARRRSAELRAYAARILRAQEDERRRISQELHDVAAQELMLLCRQLDSVEYARRSSSTRMAIELKQARLTVEGVVQSLRTFASALRPPTLEDLGLGTAIQKLLTDLESRVSLRSLFRVEGRERRLSPESELALYRIAQEALHNVEYHASATQVLVTLAFESNAVRLSLYDNGVGFDLHESRQGQNREGHLGLVGMQERAQLVGGELILDSALGRGTRVEAAIPDPSVKE